MIGTVTDMAPTPDPALVARIRQALPDTDPGTTAYLDFGARLDSVTAVQTEPGAAAWLSMHAAWNRPWIIAMGMRPEAVARCVVGLVAERGLPEGLTVERQSFARLPSELRPVEHWEWDWWYSTAAPPTRPGEAVVIDLGLTDPRVPELLAVANPDAMVHPGDRRIRGWWGIRAGALEPSAQGSPTDLVAVAAVTTMRPGVPHLGSVATHPSWRGRGLSRDLCARLTRDALAEGAPAVTLGMHAANRSARAVYSSLEYTVGQRWASGRVPGSRSSRD